MKAWRETAAVILLLALCGIVGCGRKPERILRADSKDLKHTIITAHLEEKIVPGKNLIYCSTFQLAWNELRDNIIKEDIRLEGNPPLAGFLNKKLATKDDISEGSYVAMAGFASDGILEKVNNALRSKFGGEAPTVTGSFAPEDILAYAFLLKDLRFETPFESLKTPLRFHSASGTAKVKAFGIESFNRGNARHTNLQGQVLVLHHKGQGDEIVIRLVSKSPQGEIVLAKIKPAETLLGTIQSVQEIVRDRQPQRLNDEDTLRVPKLDFDIKHSYSALLNRFHLNPGFTTYYIRMAEQDIRFRLNEKGAMLKSQARIEVESEERPKVLVFDGPFVLYLKEKHAKYPYLAIWVDNPEILVKY